MKMDPIYVVTLDHEPPRLVESFLSHGEILEDNLRKFG
jgi:hypothetical protein